MRGTLRVAGFVAAAFVAAVAVFVGSTLPPAAEQVPVDRSTTRLYGAYHVHTARSDGTGSVEDVAAAAARAGLQFVILTDHGTGTREPDPPAYYGDVLVIDAVEVSTTAGHLVALGIGQAPYPLGGNPDEVIEDIHRLGGIAIVAHPDSPKADLRWRAWNAPYDGLEWLNADSEWRDESAGRLLASTLRLFVRPAETVVSLFERPATLARWDAPRRRRPVIGLAALDAHAGVGWDAEDEPRRRILMSGPGYEQMFRALAQVVEFDGPPTGEAGTDAAELTARIAGGRSYSAILGLATPAPFEFQALQRGEAYGMGATIEPATEAVFLARVPGVSGVRLVLLEDGQPIAEGQGSLTHAATLAPGSALRVEAYHPASSVPWIVSNPIYASRLTRPAPPPAPSSGVIQPLPPSAAWVIERDPTSQGEVTADGDELRFTFGLGSRQADSPYAALVSRVDSDQGFDRVVLTARASRPMRISVQVRLPGPEGGQRWGRSTYVDETPRELILPIQAFEPLDAPSGQRPIEATVRAVLFVVDTVNADPGSAGTVWLSGVGLGVGQVSRTPGRDD